MNVTACLITWKRQANLPQIIWSLSKWSFIDEIIIVDNSKAENIINYGRYTSALKARNQIIYTQDDDCIVKNLDQVYEKFLEEPTKLCHSGTDYYERDIPNNIHGDTQMSLMGWGSFFNKDWIMTLDTYIEAFEKDYCFYRETDRIFSILLNKHSNFVLGDITELDGAHNEDALSEKGDHIEYKYLAISRALALL